MSYVKIMIHAVWGTKDREPILDKPRRTILFNHILQNAKLKDIYIDTIGGYFDHMHCVISLGADQSIAKVVQLIKGESSYWSNQENLFNTKFSWASDYFAESISDGALRAVREYILNQEEHHRRISFNEEYERFMKDAGLKL